MLARIWSAVLVQTKGVGSSLWTSMYWRIAVSNLLHAAKHTPANPLVRQFGEPTFDQVDPRTIGGREVNVKVGALGEPLPDDRGFVSGVVIDDEVYIQPGWHLRFDGIEELAELHRPMATMQLADHPVSLQLHDARSEHEEIRPGSARVHRSVWLGEKRRQRTFHRGQPGEVTGDDGAPAGQDAAVRVAHRRHTVRRPATGSSDGNQPGRAENDFRPAARRH